MRDREAGERPARRKDDFSRVEQIREKSAADDPVALWLHASESLECQSMGLGTRGPLRCS